MTISRREARAELGLTGEDNFQIKVTADGQNWHDALRIDGETGQVSLPQTPAIAPPFNLLKDSGRFAGSPPQFVHNNSTYGGTRAALDPVVNSLISRLKNANTRRYGIEFHLLKVRTGSGQSGRLDSTNGPHYLSITNRSMPISTQLTVNYHIRVESGSVAIGRAGRVFIDGTETPSAASLMTSETGWQQITQLIDYDPSAFAGYHPVLMRIYATADTVYHIAAPIVTPGHIPTYLAQVLLRVFLGSPSGCRLNVFRALLYYAKCKIIYAFKPDDCNYCNPVYRNGTPIHIGPAA